MSNTPILEEMSAFFTKRLDGYDEHMKTNVGGCREGYIKMAELVPKGTKRLLDLGCGTGLELDEIFKVLPDISVTGIDMTSAMLERLSEKHPDKKLNLICGNYFTEDFGTEPYCCAVSFQTMHHFPKSEKQGLYKKIRGCLMHGGVYIECDYMVESQAEEDFYFSENERLRREQGIGEGEIYHYDTPCTVENQKKLLLDAGFSSVEFIMRVENTTIILAKA